MTNTTTLKTLITLETKECDMAAQKLAAANKSVKESELSLQMLMDYRRDYMDQFSATAKAGVSSESYSNFQRFIKKLEQAISGQEDTLNNHKRVAAQALAVWQTHERKKLSYGLLLSNDEQKKNKLELKREQKMMDETASRSIRAQMSKANIR